jgi:hypothetical protein
LRFWDVQRAGGCWFGGTASEIPHDKLGKIGLMNAESRNRVKDLIDELRFN